MISSEKALKDAIANGQFVYFSPDFPANGIAIYLAVCSVIKVMNV